MSLAVQHLLDTLDKSADVIAYVYCDYRLELEQTLPHFLAVLLKQLGSSRLTPLPCIMKLFNDHFARRTRPTLTQLKTALHQAVEMLPTVYIIIDALDECKRHTRIELIDTIREMQNISRIKLLVTSRVIPEIYSLFRDEPSLLVRGSAADMQTYVLSRMNELSPAVHQSGLSQHVLERVVEAANGV